MSTLRTQLSRLPLQPQYGQNTQASVSVKVASQPFERIIGYGYHDYNAPSFALDVCSPRGFGREHAEDVRLLSSPLAPCQLHAEFIGNEGDVRRFYCRFLSGIPMLALKSLGIEERSEAGPPGNTQVSNTVDSRFTLGDEVLLVVELKRPYMITTQWEQATNAGLSDRNKLSKELRMSVLIYNSGGNNCFLC